MSRLSAYLFMICCAPAWVASAQAHAGAHHHPHPLISFLGEGGPALGGSLVALIAIALVVTYLKNTD